MQTLRRTIKLLFFGAILLVISAGYRLFGERKTEPEKLTFLDPKEANADVYSEGGYYSQGGYGGGCGNPGCPSIGNCEGSSGGSCFKGDILVWIKQKEGRQIYKRIEDLETGDEILGAKFNKDGSPILVPSKILRVFRHKPEPYKFSLLTAANDIQIVATDNHPFITAEANGFTTLEKLHSGQRIITALDKPIWDTVAHKVPLPVESVPLFNLKTDTQNYFVSLAGEGAVLVHNGDGSGGGK